MIIYDLMIFSPYATMLNPTGLSINFGPSTRGFSFRRPWRSQYRDNVCQRLHRSMAMWSNRFHLRPLISELPRRVHTPPLSGSPIVPTSSLRNRSSRRRFKITVASGNSGIGQGYMRGSQLTSKFGLSRADNLAKFGIRRFWRRTRR